MRSRLVLSCLHNNLQTSSWSICADGGGAHYGARVEAGSALARPTLKAAGDSASTTAAGRSFHSRTVRAANENFDADVVAFIVLNLKRCLALVLLSANSSPICCG